METDARTSSTLCAWSLMSARYGENQTALAPRSVSFAILQLLEMLLKLSNLFRYRSNTSHMRFILHIMGRFAELEAASVVESKTSVIITFLLGCEFNMHRFVFYYFP